MGDLIVRKTVKRRTSLLMGISLAMLLGAAAAFLVYALPQNALERLTTITGLARVMVQAEPPISPNDRALLAALAGIGTAGLGWVLIDWLLFGRAGMSAIIRPREDDYEDDEGSYRPADPLDLVVPAPRPVPEELPPIATDPRRPLSARTDIGDPPKPSLATPRPEPVRPGYDIGFDQLLPPIDRLAAGENGLTVPPLIQPASTMPPPLPIIDLTAAPSPPIAAPPLIFPPAGSWPPLPSSDDPASVAPVAWMPPAPIPPPVAPITEIASFPAELPDFPPPPLIASFEPSPFQPPEPVIAADAPPPVAVSPPTELARLGDLLARLERGMTNRRPTSPPPEAVVRATASLAEVLQAPYRAPPAFLAAPPIQPAPPAPIEPPPTPESIVPPQTILPVEQPPQPSSQADDLLDQPLHVALDVLRARIHG